MKRRDAALRVMRDHDVSQPRACRLVGVDPKAVRRERPQVSAEIRKEMQEIAGKRRGFGYRRIGILLERKRHTHEPQEAVSHLPRGRAVSEAETTNAATRTCA